MTTSNFLISRAFVWAEGRDSPQDGYHVTPGDPGGGTKAGIIETTWAAAVRLGVCHGSLATASDEQLSAVLQTLICDGVCNSLPSGLDLLYFNGKMMSGGYPRLLQQSLGFMGISDPNGRNLDGHLGPITMAAVQLSDVPTLINALSGIHYDYLTRLTAWSRFSSGWTKRIQAARVAALALASATPSASSTTPATHFDEAMNRTFLPPSL